MRLIEVVDKANSPIIFQRIVDILSLVNHNNSLFALSVKLFIQLFRFVGLDKIISCLEIANGISKHALIKAGCKILRNYDTQEFSKLIYSYLLSQKDNNYEICYRCIFLLCTRCLPEQILHDLPVWLSNVEWSMQLAGRIFYKFSNLIQPELIVDYFVRMKHFVESSPQLSSKQLCLVTDIVRECIRIDSVWLVLSQDVACFCMFMLRIVQLNDDDISNSVNDPITFLRDFYSGSHDEFRSNLVSAMSLRRNEIGTTLLGMAEKADNESTLFLTLLLLSGCAIPPADRYFPLLHNQSHLIRCAALDVIRSLREPTTICLNLLADPIPLVRYFAAECIPQILDREVALPIPMIITTLFHLSEMFHDSDLLLILKSTIKSSLTEIEPVAQQIVESLFKMFCETQSAIVLSAISLVIQKYTSLSTMLLQPIYAVLSQGCDSLDLMDLLANIAAISPEITEEHWAILEVPILFEIEEGRCKVLRNLSIRDKSAALAHHIAEYGMSHSEILGIENVMHLFASFVDDHNDFLDHLVFENIRRYPRAACELYTSMTVFGKINFDPLLEEWIQCCQERELKAVMHAHQEEIPEEMKEMLERICFEKISDDLEEEIIDEMDDFHVARISINRLP